jgi:hypothetical protein
MQARPYSKFQQYGSAMKYRSRFHQLGLLYVGILLLLTVLAIGALKVVESASFAIQREMEIELLDRGRQVRDAIGRYYEKSPGGVKLYPRTLEALVFDDRFLGIERYLRKVMPDPFTRANNWILIYANDGGIKGITSASLKVPLAQNGFEMGESSFTNAKSYSDWQFVYEPRGKR